MKTLLLVLAYVTLATSVRDKRSYGHTQAYPVSVHTVVRPSNTLPVYEYPESTQIDTLSKTVYSVSVPITHTVHLEQPEHSRQVVYHNPPASIPSYTSYAHTPVYTAPQTVYSAPSVYTPSVYTPSVYTSHVYSPTVYAAPKRVYTGASPWPYRRYADPWC